jgi:hypothetical protein
MKKQTEQAIWPPNQEEDDYLDPFDKLIERVEDDLFHIDKATRKTQRLGCHKMRPERVQCWFKRLLYRDTLP